ncbi:hypothetical protein [Roseateles sp.]|uniref:hypothetical protein n=1 Tax=Roseateles sp. TaxID=1971397 RepID=UPI003264ABAA
MKMLIGKLVLLGAVFAGISWARSYESEVALAKLIYAMPGEQDVISVSEKIRQRCKLSSFDEHWPSPEDCERFVVETDSRLAKEERDRWLLEKRGLISDRLRAPLDILASVILFYAVWLVLRAIFIVALPPLRSVISSFTGRISRNALTSRRLRKAEEEYQQIFRLHQSC